MDLSNKIASMANKISKEIDKDTIYKEWSKYINMSPKELESWSKDENRLLASLNREEAGNIQSGYDSLHRIKRRINKKKEDWTDEDYKNAQQEINFVKRMLGMKPGKNVGDSSMSKWEISLRNWGHDPRKSNSPGKSKLK